MTLEEMKIQFEEAKKKQQRESKVEKQNAKTIATLQQTADKISAIVKENGSILSTQALQSAQAVIAKVKELADSKDDISQDSNLDAWKVICFISEIGASRCPTCERKPLAPMCCNS
jgi:hypothetical protein